MKIRVTFEFSRAPRPSAAAADAGAVEVEQEPQGPRESDVYSSSERLGFQVAPFETHQNSRDEGDEDEE